MSIRTPVPIQLSDPYVTSMVNNPSIVTRWPQVKSIAIAIQQAGRHCRDCGAGGRTLAAQIQRGRDFVINMSSSDLQELKRLLKIPQRQFIAYVGSQRVIR